MTFSLTWLPDILKQAGLKVAETDGWQTRGRGPMGSVRGVLCHHTATRAQGNMPSLNLLINGRSDLTGPLAQLGLGRDGTIYVIAAGRANHAGIGHWQNITTGNSSFIGIEAENDGIDEPWPEVQLDAYHRAVAAILLHIGAPVDMCVGHKEYAGKRKTDPDFDMPAFRQAVAELMGGKAPRPLIAAIDRARRPTLRRGMQGDDVKRAQGLLGLTVDGMFSVRMEAALRTYQRQHRLVPDGILGPATWQKLEPVQAAATAAAAPATAPAEASAVPVSPAEAASLPPDLPAADTAGSRAQSRAGSGYGPDGGKFASCSRSGFYTTGSTTIAAWLQGLTSKPDCSDSVIRILKAMSVNEGRFEAVNSYDGSFMSFGILQWTAGAKGDPGELAYLLSVLKAKDPNTYQDCFGAYGLDTAAQGRTGRLSLNGRELSTPEDKTVLRDVAWAYRFWRAGHAPAVREAQFEVAAGRLSQFLSDSVEGHPLGAWLTSERGIAHLLDQHVNRPGNVPGTLIEAVKSVYGAAPPDPARLDDKDEEALIDAYLELRASTSMTDSDGRAARIDVAVANGALSASRGSFAA